jgi:hypothetical protein
MCNPQSMNTGFMVLVDVTGREVTEQSAFSAKAVLVVLLVVWLLWCVFGGVGACVWRRSSCRGRRVCAVFWLLGGISSVLVSGAGSMLAPKTFGWTGACG